MRDNEESLAIIWLIYSGSVRAQGQTQSCEVSPRLCFIVPARDLCRESLSARYIQPSSHASASPGRTAFRELTSTRHPLLGGRSEENTNHGSEQEMERKARTSLSSLPRHCGTRAAASRSEMGFSRGRRRESVISSRGRGEWVSLVCRQSYEFICWTKTRDALQRDKDVAGSNEKWDFAERRDFRVLSSPAQISVYEFASAEPSGKEAAKILLKGTTGESDFF